MNHFCVYIHKRPDGSPFYVGKGTLSRARKLLRKNPHHRNIVTKYGTDNITVQILVDNLSESEAFSQEISLIAGLRAAGARLCNMTSGGEGGVPSEEARQRMSEAQRKRAPHPAVIIEKMRRAHLGKKHPEEVKSKIGAAHRGKIVSQSTREKLRIANIGKKPSAEATEKNRLAQLGNKRRLGMKASQETRARLSAAHKGVPWTEKRRKAYEARWGDVQSARI